MRPDADSAWCSGMPSACARVAAVSSVAACSSLPVLLDTGFPLHPWLLSVVRSSVRVCRRDQLAVLPRRHLAIGLRHDAGPLRAAGGLQHHQRASLLARPQLVRSRMGHRRRCHGWQRPKRPRPRARSAITRSRVAVASVLTFFILVSMLNH